LGIYRNKNAKKLIFKHRFNFRQSKIQSRSCLVT